MKPQLYPYQQVAAEWLAARPRALLADEMRVGKTPAAIRGADLIRAQNVLWLTTGTARAGHAGEWVRFQEIERDVTAHFTSRGPIKPGVNIMTYDLLCQGLWEAVRATPWDLIVCDESHFLQSPEAKRTQALLGSRCTGSGLASKAAHVWLLSGTPAPSHYGQLWPVLRGLFPAVIKGDTGKPMSRDVFTRTFTSGYEGAFGRVITGSCNAERLSDMLRPIYLRRTLADVEPELPAVRSSDWLISAAHMIPGALDVRLSIKERDGEKLLEELRKKDDTGEKKNWRISVACAKIPSVVEAISEEIRDNPGKKYVIFAWHHEVMYQLRDALTFKRIKSVGITGLMTQTRKDESLRSFRSAGVSVLVGQIAAAGTAIDLSASNDIIFLETSWTPGENAQASMRCTNSKKRVPVTVRYTMLEGSLDVKLMTVVRRKAEDLLKLWEG